MGWTGSAPSPESEFLGIWRCSSPNNRSKWCNPTFEALMDEEIATIKHDKFKAYHAMVTISESLT